MPIEHFVITIQSVWDKEPNAIATESGLIETAGLTAEEVYEEVVQQGVDPIGKKLTVPVEVSKAAHSATWQCYFITAKSTNQPISLTSYAVQGNYGELYLTK
ncbi:MAG TPA: hypothetical protein VJJ78_00640 [Candidatus Saccharimonadales bacterium]|nr:hypothetical protein [Candidatus Saccharimonadales bacterium]